MNYYDIKMLQGIAELTAGWAIRRDQFFEFACAEGGQRWKTRQFQEFMHAEYIKTDTPITLRLYSLDEANQKLVLRYVEEKLMNGMASQLIEF